MVVTTKTKVLALIPARGGSKGLPGKNIKILKGKPMTNWTIEAAVKSTVIDDVLISTDIEELIREAEKMGLDSVQRPDFLAADKTSMVDVVVHALGYMSQAGKTYEYLCLLQPTSPLRTATDINNAFEKMVQSSADSVISVKQENSSCLKWFVSDNETIFPLAFDKTLPFARRQDLPNVCSANGAIYIIKTEEFLKRRLFVTDHTAAYFMSESASYDVDTLDDFKLVESILEENC